MPYIPLDSSGDYPGRQHFDKAAQNIVKLSSKDSFADDFANVLWSLATGIYGDGGESFPTRYHQQNAFSGVCICMSEEWVRRTGVEPEISEEDDSQSEIGLLEPNSPLGKEVVSVMEKFPREDITLRDGCLNYFLTVLMVQAVEAKYLQASEVPMRIMEIFYYWYEEVIGDYEDKARDKNGEVFTDNLI